MPNLLSPTLIEAVASQVAIDPRGIHGLGHWARVYANGQRLAEACGADPQVLALFALFHDSRRLNEGLDPEHGPRGAELARQFHGRYFILEAGQLQRLLIACRLHTAARTHEDLTVQACFDADRLDLGRVGKVVDPHFLCTAAAQDPQCIAWASGQSKACLTPDNPLGQALTALSSCAD